MGWFNNYTNKSIVKSFIGNYKVVKKKYPELSKRELYMKVIEFRVGGHWKTVNENILVYKDKIPLELKEKDTFKDVVRIAVIIELAKRYSGGSKSLLEHDDSVKEITKCVDKIFKNFQED